MSKKTWQYNGDFVIVEMEMNITLKYSWSFTQWPLVAISPIAGHVMVNPNPLHMDYATNILGFFFFIRN